MLSSSMLREEVELIVDLLAQNKYDEARQRVTHLSPEVSSPYGRGAMLALNGVMNVMESKNKERMGDPEKILRATERIPKLHITDDFDKGYMQTISKWAKKVRAPQRASGS